MRLRDRLEGKLRQPRGKIRLRIDEKANAAARIARDGCGAYRLDVDGVVVADLEPEDVAGQQELPDLAPAVCQQLAGAHDPGNDHVPVRRGIAFSEDRLAAIIVRYDPDGLEAAQDIMRRMRGVLPARRWGGLSPSDAERVAYADRAGAGGDC